MDCIIPSKHPRHIFFYHELLKLHALFFFSFSWEGKDQEKVFQNDNILMTDNRSFTGKTKNL